MDFTHYQTTDFSSCFVSLIFIAIVTRITTVDGLSDEIQCSDSVGWSNEIQFRTPPAGGSDELKFIIFGDMGKAPRDNSTEHYIQVGSFTELRVHF